MNEQFYNRIVIDLGTGDGRFVFKNALKTPNTLFIGIDPSEKQLEKYAKKATRKKLKNALFKVGSIENFPKDIEKTDEINITLPWGSLLESVVKVKTKEMATLVSVLKNGARLNIIFGYHQEHEPDETERLTLPILNENYIKNNMIPLFVKLNLKCENYRKIEKKDLRKIESTWAKKLAFGKNRQVFKLNLIKI